MSEVTDKQRIAELEAELASFRETITEIIHGSMDAKRPGLASRLQRLETEQVESLETRLALLEDNRIKDGQLRVASLEQTVDTLSGWVTKIGSAVVLAIVGAIISGVINE